MNLVWLRLFFPLLALLGSAWLTAWARSYALKSQLLDVPNSRSAHRVPTPRGGGLGLVIVFVSSLVTIGLSLIFQYDDIISGLTLLSLAVGGAAVAWVGWRDDRTPLSPTLRLCVHFGSSLLALVPWIATESGLSTLLVAFVSSDWMASGLFSVLNIVFALLFSVWMINLTNFMDGIDGLAGVEAVTASLTLAALSAGNGMGIHSLVYSVLCCACLGFLVYNWPPAKIFMGDVGSGFLGFVFAGLVIWTHLSGGVQLVPSVIVLGVFVVDATYTLLERGLRGKQIWLSHSEHAYQHAARSWGHKRVTTTVLFINVAWLAPMAIWAAIIPSQQILALVVAFLPLIWLVRFLKSGSMKMSVSMKVF